MIQYLYMKICKDCKKEKQESDYYGVQGECKECTKKRVRKNTKEKKSYYVEYDKKRQKENIKRMWSHRYLGIKQRTLGKGSHLTSAYKKDLMTKKEFFEWCQSTKKTFEKLKKQWQKSGYQRKFAPSIDRIDNTKGYIAGNLQWLTLSENIKKNPSKNFKRNYEKD